MISEWVSQQVKRDRSQIKRETFRCGGKGGQKQNKTETGVRLTDLVTGMSCEGREHRTQSQNLKAAFDRLVRRLIAHYEALEREGIEERFRAPDRTVRTYNEKRSEVKCEITGTRANYDKTLDGQLDGLIRARLEHDRGAE